MKQKDPRLQASKKTSRQLTTDKSESATATTLKKNSNTQSKGTSKTKTQIKSVDKPNSEVSSVSTSKPRALPTLLKLNPVTMSRYRQRGSLMILMLTFLLYLYTMPKTIVGYGDSDLLLSLAHNLGVAHPPGYPLYILLLKFAQLLPLPLTIAARGHFLSVILSSLTAVIVFNLSWEIWKRPRSNQFILITPEIDRLILSLLPAFSLVFSFLFWQYGHIAEKYSLLVFLSSLVIWQAFTILKQPKVKPSSWIWLGLTFGLALVSHYTAIYLAPALGWLLYSRQSKAEVYERAIGVTVITFLLASSLIVFFQMRQPQLSWHFQPNVSGLVSMLKRQDFSGQAYGRSDEQIFGLLTRINLTESTTGVTEYLKHTFAYFGWWFLPIILLAARYGFKRRHEHYMLTGLLTLSTGVGLAATFLKWPNDLGSQAILQRQYLLSYVSLAVFSAFGWAELIRRFGKAITIVSQSKIALATLSVVIVGAFSWQIYQVYPQVDLSSYNFIDSLYRHSLNTVPENSIVTCYSDTSCFALLYLHYVDNLRPDSTIVPLAYPLVNQAIESNQLRHLTYTSNPYLMLDVVTTNIAQRPIYAVDLNNYYYNLLGLQPGFLFYLPQDNFGKITQTIPEELPELNTEFSDQIRHFKHTPLDLMKQWQILNFAQQHLLNGITYLQMGERERSLDQINRAANIHFMFGPEEQAKITSIRNNIEYARPSEVYAPGSSIKTAESYLEYIPKLLETNHNSQALLAAKAAAIVEPDNVEARLWLANMYEKMGDHLFAQYEYQNALLFDPANATASSRLDVLTLPQE